MQRDGRPHLILDTKYKSFHGAPNDADRNQMYAYCGATGVDRAMLIYADAAPVNWQARLKGSAGPVTLLARSLPLDGPLADFRDRCAAWARSVTSDE